MWNSSTLLCRDLGVAIIDQLVPGIDHRLLLQLEAHQPQGRLAHRFDRRDAGEVKPGLEQRVEIRAHHFAEAAETREKRLRDRLDIASLDGGEQQHLEQLVIRQIPGSGVDQPLAQPLAMAPDNAAARGLGELASPAVVARGGRKRSDPVRPGFQAAGAVDLPAQRRYPFPFAGVEHPRMPRAVPPAAKEARPRREIGMEGSADREAAVLFDDRDSHARPAVSAFEPRNLAPGPHPMHAAEHQRRAEPGRARRRHVERHLSSGQRLQPPPQPFEFGLVDAGADPAGVSEPSVRIVIAEQQRAETRPRALGIGPADHHEFLAVEAFDLEPQTEPRDIVHPSVQNPGSLSVLSCCKRR